VDKYMTLFILLLVAAFAVLLMSPATPISGTIIDKRWTSQLFPARDIYILVIKQPNNKVVERQVTLAVYYQYSLGDEVRNFND
jgi:hypothetical protein